MSGDNSGPLDATITISENASLIRMGLQNLDAEAPQIGRMQLYDQSMAVVRLMKSYPEERAGQKYVRTYDFQHSWLIQAMDNGYEIVNDAARNGREYGVYVVGDAIGQEHQAWMHVGRWQEFAEVLQAMVAMLPSQVEQNIVIWGRQYGLEIETI